MHHVLLLHNRLPSVAYWAEHPPTPYHNVNAAQRVTSRAYRDDTCDGIQEDVGAGNAAFDEALPQHSALQMGPRICRHNFEALAILQCKACSLTSYLDTARAPIHTRGGTKQEAAAWRDTADSMVTVSCYKRGTVNTVDERPRLIS